MHPSSSSPRPVPRALRLWIHLGGAVRQILWLAVLIGAGMSAVFIPQADLGCHSYDRVASGEVEHVEETSSSRRRRSVHEVVARFDDADGQTHRVRSYGESPPPVGGRVLVHYQGGDPEQARIDGLRAAPFGWSVLFALLVPGLAMVMLLTRVRESRRTVHLLGHGVLTEGVIVGRRSGSFKINRRAETLLTFEYEVAGGRRHRCEVGTFRPEVLEDEPREKLLYDPERPDHATTLDHLPGAPQIGKDGSVGGHAGGALVLILPGLAIVALLALAVATLLG